MTRRYKAEKTEAKLQAKHKAMMDERRKAGRRWKPRVSGLFKTHQVFAKGSLNPMSNVHIDYSKTKG